MIRSRVWRSSAEVKKAASRADTEIALARRILRRRSSGPGAGAGLRPAAHSAVIDTHSTPYPEALNRIRRLGSPPEEPFEERTNFVHRPLAEADGPRCGILVTAWT